MFPWSQSHRNHFWRSEIFHHEQGSNTIMHHERPAPASSSTGRGVSCGVSLNFSLAHTVMFCLCFIPHTEGGNEILWYFSQCKRSQLLAHVILCGRVSQFFVDSQFFTFIIVIIQKLWKWPKNFVDTFNSSTHTQRWQPAPVCHSSPIWPLLDRAITLSLSLSHSMVPWFLPTSRITRIEGVIDSHRLKILLIV